MVIAAFAACTAVKRLWAKFLRFMRILALILAGVILGWYAKTYHHKISKTWQYQMAFGWLADEPTEKVRVTEKVSDGTVTVARIPGKAWHAFREEFNKPSEVPPASPATQPTTKPAQRWWPFYLRSKPGPG
ncbi:MAG: hypothetical protein V4519_03395 [Patescibacteria group bacterium]